MNIKENITTINQFHERYGHKVEGIVIHSMWGYYQGSISWFKNPKAQASCHYCISKKGEVTMCVRETSSAWHAGNVTITKDKAPKLIQNKWGVNPNFFTIGVELEDERNKNYNYPEMQYWACVELCADVCRRYKLKPSRDNIIMHKELDPARRSDPVGSWNHNRFIEDVKTILGESKVYEWVGEVKVVDWVDALNKRLSPTTKSPIVGTRKRNEVFAVKSFEKGEDISYQDGKVSTKFWWKDKDGYYIWSGGTDLIPDLKSYPNLRKGVQVKDNMNESERNLNDLKNRESDLVSVVNGLETELQAKENELMDVQDEIKRVEDEIERLRAEEESTDDTIPSVDTSEPTEAEQVVELVKQKGIVEDVKRLLGL